MVHSSHVAFWMGKVDARLQKGVDVKFNPCLAEDMFHRACITYYGAVVDIEARPQCPSIMRITSKFISLKVLPLPMEPC